MHSVFKAIDYFSQSGIEKKMTRDFVWLQVYTGYRFFTRACNKADCTNSDIVTLATSQLPPSYVAPPALDILGKSADNSIIMNIQLV